MRRVRLGSLLHSNMYLSCLGYLLVISTSLDVKDAKLDVLYSFNDPFLPEKRNDAAAKLWS